MDALNLTELLVAVLAVVGAIMVLRKRYDSNVPLLFYFVLIVFCNFSDRAINPYLLYAGLVLAMLLRFEFMGGGFVKLIAFLTAASLASIVFAMVSEVLT